MTATVPYALPHRCEAPGCANVFATQRPLCQLHWWLVSEATRRAVWQAWRLGEAAWRGAVRLAVAEVSAGERAFEFCPSTGGWRSRRPKAPKRKARSEIPGYL